MSCSGSGRRSTADVTRMSVVETGVPLQRVLHVVLEERHVCALERRVRRVELLRSPAASASRAVKRPSSRPTTSRRSLSSSLRKRPESTRRFADRMYLRREPRETGQLVRHRLAFGVGQRVALRGGRACTRRRRRRAPRRRPASLVLAWRSGGSFLWYHAVAANVWTCTAQATSLFGAGDSV